jgi:RecB family exonuclease
MPIYSHSKIKTFEQCPWKFRLEYLDRVETAAESIEIFLGHRVHEALESLYRQLQATGVAPDEETVVTAYHAAWDARWHDQVFVVRTHTEPAQYRALGERYLRDYFADHAPFGSDVGTTVGVETSLSFPLDDAGTYQIRCVIDRLARRGDGVWEIHDYKTGATLPTQRELDRDRQLALYQMALQHTHPEAERVELVWHYLAHRRRMTSRRTPEQLASLRRDLHHLVETIERAAQEPNTLAPVESSLCAWCAYPAHCPAKKHVFRIRALAPDQRRADHGVRLVDGYRAGMDAGLAGTPEEVAYRARLLNYARSHDVSIVEGTHWRARIIGDDVVLETVRYADRRC